MATNNNVDVGLSGSTGTGSFVGVNSPTLITPTLGAATATNVAFNPTTGGPIGTTVADNASSGKVGEVISSAILAGSAISISNATPKNLTSISLTAGDWDVTGNLVFITGSGTTATSYSGAISTTSATLPDASLTFVLQTTYTVTSNQGFPVPYQRINVSSTTTIYLVANAAFTVSTMTMCGLLSARRVR